MIFILNYYFPTKLNDEVLRENSLRTTFGSPSLSNIDFPLNQLFSNVMVFSFTTGGVTVAGRSKFSYVYTELL